MVSTALSKSDQSAIDRHLTTIDKAKTDMVHGAVIIGASLLAVREILPKPEFVPWVEENCGFSKTTAYRYCEVAEVFGKFPKIENFQDSALYVLAKCEAAATKAKAMASRGKRITHELAKEIVKEVEAEEESHSQIGNDESEVIDVESVAVSDAPEIEGELIEPEPPASARHEVEREPGDDTELLKAEAAKRRNSGKEVVSPKERTEAKKAFGVVTRFIDKLKRHDELRVHLSAVAAVLEGKA